MSTDTTRLQQYAGILSDTQNLASTIRFMGESLLVGDGAESTETRLEELFRLYETLHINEQRDDPVKSQVADWKTSVVNSLEVASYALVTTLENLCAKIDRLVSTASPGLLRQLKIVRTSDFGDDGTFEFAHTQFRGRLFMGRMDKLPPDHVLHELVPIESR